MKLLWTSVVLLVWLANYADAAARFRNDCNCTSTDYVCRCSFEKTMQGMPKMHIPQLVLFTFDDAVNTINNDFYNQLFPPERVNPNGCPISMTLFLQDKDTVYPLVSELYKRGMEIAVHSVSHRSPQSFWRYMTPENMTNEIVTQRRNINRKANVPMRKIIGWRSPFLVPSGDELFTFLQDNGFEYDATLGMGKRDFGTDSPWPFTLDGTPYRNDDNCEVRKCPKNKHKGFWEFPVVPLLYRYKDTWEGQKIDMILPYPYVDSWAASDSAEEAFRFLKRNFDDYRQRNRAPFMLNMHAAWFLRNPKYLEAMDYFIQYITSMNDVYVVSVQKALQWLKDPTPLYDLEYFELWGCQNRKQKQYQPIPFMPTFTEPIIQTTPFVPMVPPCIQGANCVAPDCRCSSAQPPDGMKRQKVPQMVAFTFDDALSVGNIHHYRTLFKKTRLNPNNCPITMTLFLQDQYTDYSFVNELYLAGHEMGDHSISHKVPNSWWKTATTEQLSEEVVGQRRNIHCKGKVPLNEVQGWRSPYLQSTGETQFQLLKDEGFMYDTTLPYTREYMIHDGPYPFTLDYGFEHACNIPPCPKLQYQGLWELPIVFMINPVSGHECSYVDSCRPETKAESYQYLMDNFDSYYEGSRAPFILNMHAAWLNIDHNYWGMDQFIQELIKKDDVYIITAQQVLAWMKDPRRPTIDKAKSYTPWGCAQPRESVTNFNSICSSMSSNPGSGGTDTGNGGSGSKYDDHIKENNNNNDNTGNKHDSKYDDLIRPGGGGNQGGADNNKVDDAGRRRSDYYNGYGAASNKHSGKGLWISLIIFYILFNSNTK